ncbi:MAG: TlpA family protein disulfide reductase [Sediminibacterium sp.]
MKPSSRFLLPLFIAITLGGLVFSPGYSQNFSPAKDTLPAFHLQLIDSSFYISNQFSPKKFIALIYFSPTCGHCIDMTEELVRESERLSNLLLLMVTYQPIEVLRLFGERYKLHKLPDFRLGNDISYALVPHFKIDYTPFVALYGADRQLIRTWRSPEQPFRILEFLQFIQTN